MMRAYFRHAALSAAIALPLLLAGTAHADATACGTLNDCMVQGQGAAGPAEALVLYGRGISLWKAAEGNDLLARAHYIRGQTQLQYFAQTRAPAELAAAEQDFQKSISLAPAEFSAYSGMGIVMANRGQFDQALEWMGRGIAANPDNPLSHFERGGFYLAKGDNELALADFNKAIGMLSGRSFDPKTQLYTMKVGVDLPPHQRIIMHVKRAQVLNRLGRQAEFDADMAVACSLGERRACR